MGFLDFFKSRKRKASSNSQNDATLIQSRPGRSHPFGALDQYIPLQSNQFELYKIMREAVPIIDRAVRSIVRLVGSPTVISEDESLQKDLEEFLSGVKVNAKQSGLDAFLTNYLDALLQNGFASGEIVPNRARNGVYALASIAGSTLVLKRTSNPLELLITQRQPLAVEPVVFENQDLILFTALNPEEDDPRGVSLLRSFPFVTGILLKIYNAMGNNWDRFGNLQYQVTYKPPDKADVQMDTDKVKERINQITKNWREAMTAKKRGEVKDFIGVGDISVKVIGADGQILDSAVPVKQMLEQIVAATGLPPFLLGLAWSTTERMSTQQADFLTSELEAYRAIMTPVVKQIVDWWMRFTGRQGDYEVAWPDINLQDAVELAKADLLREQAVEKRIKNVVAKRNENIIDQQQAAEELGYEEPAGDAPPHQMGPAPPPNREMSKKKAFDSVEHRSAYWKALADRDHHHEEKGFDGPEIDQLMSKFSSDMFAAVLRLEKSILRTVGITQNGKSTKTLKDVEPGSYFYLTPEQAAEIQEEFETFVDELLGDQSSLTSQERYDMRGYYIDHMMASFGLGAASAWEWVKADIPDLAPEHGPITTPMFQSPYVRELLDNGMHLVVTRAREKYDTVMQIMREHAAVGDNPTVWARDLQNSLHEELGGQRWYWERLARSESAMAIDRAADEEYAAEGILYVEWVAAPDACRKICAPLHGNIYTMNNAPRVVADTHPHCRCRKRPRTARYAQESGRVVA